MTYRGRRCSGSATPTLGAGGYAGPLRGDTGLGAVHVSTLDLLNHESGWCIQLRRSLRVVGTPSGLVPAQYQGARKKGPNTGNWETIRIEGQRSLNTRDVREV